MAGFRRAKAEQAALKMGMFGPSGCGKTFTTLLIAEGLAKQSGKRIAFVDTERGTDFYVQAVPDRQVHPGAFDIDAIYTRSLTEVLAECRKLDPAEHGVIIIDSMTHLWESAIAAYRGKRNGAGQIPFQAWGGIKKPYKDLMHVLINSPMHVFILGRQANEWGEDEATGETVMTGWKMRAEGETAYEPHILIRMESVRPRAGKRVLKHEVATPTAFIEKDRTGILQGRLIEWPNFDNVARPLLGLLGDTQAKQATEEETAIRDADALAAAERQKVALSHMQRVELEAKLTLARTLGEVEAIGKQITPELKAKLTTEDVGQLRNSYLAALDRAKGQAVAKPAPADLGDAAE
jgi:hypothetical protein